MKTNQARNTAPQFFSAAVIIASLIDSISTSLSVAFSGVNVIVTAIDFFASSNIFTLIYIEKLNIT